LRLRVYYRLTVSYWLINILTRLLPRWRVSPLVFA